MTHVMFHLAETVAGHLWAVSWQAAILAGLVWLITVMFRNTSTVFRYWLWMIVLLRLCIPVGFVLPEGVERLLGDTISTSEIAAPVRFVTEKIMQPPSVETEEIDTRSSTETIPSEPPKRITAGTLAGFAWGGIVLLIVGLVLWRVVVIGRRINSSPEITRPEIVARFQKLKAEIGVQRPVGLRYLEMYNTDVPAVIGVKNPSVLLPVHIVDTWSVDEIEPLLLHELAHVKRGDLLLNWMQIVIQAVYFFHPLVWYVNSRIRQHREELSDDLAVHHLGTGKKQYVRSILRVMESVVSEPVFGFLGIGFSERKHSLGWRIERMLNTGYKGYGRITYKTVSILVFVMIMGCVVSLLPSIVTVLAQDTIPTVYTPGELTVASAAFEPDKTNSTVKIDIEYLPLGIAFGKSFEPTDIAMWGFENVSRALDTFSPIKPEFTHRVNLDSSLESIPVLFISAKGDFSITNNEAKNLRNFLRNGGFVILDNPEPEKPQSDSPKSLKKIVYDALGENIEFQSIPDDHELYHVFFDFDDGPPQGGEKIADSRIKDEIYYPARVEGVWIDGRLAAVYLHNGYFYQCWQNPLGPQARFGTNLVLFGALQEDGMMHRWSKQQ